MDFTELNKPYEITIGMNTYNHPISLCLTDNPPRQHKFVVPDVIRDFQWYFQAPDWSISFKDTKLKVIAYDFNYNVIEQFMYSCCFYPVSEEQMKGNVFNYTFVRGEFNHIILDEDLLPPELRKKIAKTFKLI